MMNRANGPGDESEQSIGMMNRADEQGQLMSAEMGSVTKQIVVATIGTGVLSIVDFAIIRRIFVPSSSSIIN